jgi:para-aminobenzoate synthetase/4-amino-4-deoxychorismate lyase
MRAFVPGEVLSIGTAVVRDASSGRWLLFRDPVEVVTAWTTAEVVPCLEHLERRVEQDGLFAAGMVSYEAAPAFDIALSVREAPGFPLLWFGLYHEPGEIVPESGAGHTGLPCPEWTASVTRRGYESAIAAVKDHLRAGTSYQVNYTLRLRSAFTGCTREFFLAQAASHDPPCGAYLDLGRWAVCSASPELFFTLGKDRITSRPMKGTAPRGLTPEQDALLARQLQGSEKERAENLMITDMVRNDLGRIAVPGSVRVPALFALERYSTLWQMTSTVDARTTASLAEVFGALFPPASITGAPKARTMEIIAHLEDTPRRVYTGAIGFVAPGRRAQFNVAIRTLLVDREHGTAEYGVGGGIVWDSNVEQEWLECMTKAKVLQESAPEFSLLETLLWTPETGWFLEAYHLRRLALSAEYFGFPLDGPALLRDLDRAASVFPRRPMRVRLLLARDGALDIHAEPFEQQRSGSPVTITLARSPVDASDPFLYHKTTRRSVYEEALRSCPGYADVLLYNARGEVTESTIANVLVRTGGRLCTPTVGCGLLAGTLRAWLLEHGCISERVFSVEEVLACDEVYLMNSVRGIYPVILEDGARAAAVAAAV